MPFYFNGCCCMISWLYSAAVWTLLRIIGRQLLIALFLYLVILPPPSALEPPQIQCFNCYKHSSRWSLIWEPLWGSLHIIHSTTEVADNEGTIGVYCLTLFVYWHFVLASWHNEENDPWNHIPKPTGLLCEIGFTRQMWKIQSCGWPFLCWRMWAWFPRYRRLCSIGITFL